MHKTLQTGLCFLLLSGLSIPNVYAQDELESTEGEGEEEVVARKAKKPEKQY